MWSEYYIYIWYWTSQNWNYGRYTRKKGKDLSEKCKVTLEKEPVKLAIKKQQKFCGIIPINKLAKLASNKQHVFLFYILSYIFN